LLIVGDPQGILVLHPKPLPICVLNIIVILINYIIINYQIKKNKVNPTKAGNGTPTRIEGLFSSQSTELNRFMGYRQ
jgi:hypothetical protein